MRDDVSHQSHHHITPPTHKSSTHPASAYLPQLEVVARHVLEHLVCLGLQRLVLGAQLAGERGHGVVHLGCDGEVGGVRLRERNVG